MSEKPIEQWTIEDVRAEVSRMTGAKDDRSMHAGVILLSPFVIGSRGIDDIVAFTDLPEEFVREVAARLLANGIWVGDSDIRVQWFDDENGPTAFNLDVSVALGRLTRLPDFTYQMTDAGRARIEKMIGRKRP